MADHMRRVAEVGAILGADVAVYGAPNTRLLGGLSLDAARALASQRFSELGDMGKSCGLTIGIESIPRAYGGEFLTSAFDVIAMVRAVHHPFVRLHLDTGCVLLAGNEIDDAIREGFEWLSHFHISEPQLADFSLPRAKHDQAAAALRQCGYSQWVAIEMQAQPVATIGALSTAIEYVMATYGTR
jgi:sugar phosphate isomerase/epimerase